MLVLQFTQANPFAQLNAIASEVRARKKSQSSDHTTVRIPHRHIVRRQLAEAAIHSRLAVTKFNLTNAHKANRFPSAQETLTYEEDYWDKVKFSNEKTSDQVCWECLHSELSDFTAPCV